MPTSLDNLYTYDEALTTAWKDILQDAFQSNPLEQYDNIKVEIAPSDVGDSTPFVAVQLSDVIGLDQKHLIDGVPFYNAWQAHLISRIYTQAGTNSHLQYPMIGIIRARAALFNELFTVENLPYHTLLFMRDAGLHRGLLRKELLDYADVIYLVKFAIRADAWPV